MILANPGPGFLADNARDVIILVTAVVVVLKLPLLVWLIIAQVREKNTTALYKDLLSRFAALSVDGQDTLLRAVVQAKDEVIEKARPLGETWREGDPARSGSHPVVPGAGGP